MRRTSLRGRSGEASVTHRGVLRARSPCDRHDTKERETPVPDHVRIAYHDTGSDSSLFAADRWIEFDQNNGATTEPHADHRERKQSVKSLVA